MFFEFWNNDAFFFPNYLLTSHQWLKWFCEAGGGAHLTKPGWSKPHTHSNLTNLALFRHKITLYRFNQGAHIIAGGSNGSRGLSPLVPPHFNHCISRDRCAVSCDTRVRLRNNHALTQEEIVPFRTQRIRQSCAVVRGTSSPWSS